jgi:hypothetical protein
MEIETFAKLYKPEHATGSSALDKPISTKQKFYIWRLLKDEEGITGAKILNFFGVAEWDEIKNGQAMYIIKFLNGEVTIPVPLRCSCGCDHVIGYVKNKTFTVEYSDCNCDGNSFHNFMLDEEG